MLSLRIPLPRLLAIFLPTLFLSVFSRTSLAGNDKNYTYLALGDSVAFGLDITKLPPFSTSIPPADSFKGYPEFLADMEHLTQSKKEVNASCPGETSSAFISGAGPDFGCYSLGPQGQPPFKDARHVQYTGSQLDFAVSQLKANKHINLVTLNTGSNDLLVILFGLCGGSVSCVGPYVPGALGAYAANLSTIFQKIRVDAQYAGQLILLTYYSPNETFTPLVEMLNSTAMTVAKGFNVQVVDGGLAFTSATPLTKSFCTAGLLVTLPDGSCDIHPSAKGQQVLAEAIDAVVSKK